VAAVTDGGRFSLEPRGPAGRVLLRGSATSAMAPVSLRGPARPEGPGARGAAPGRLLRAFPSAALLHPPLRSLFSYS